MVVQEVFFAPRTLSAAQGPISLPSDLSMVELELFWSVLDSACNVQVDLDVSLLLFNSKGMKFQEITFNHTSNENGSIRHCGDSIGGSSEGDSETISANLKACPTRIHSMIMVATIASGTLRNVKACGYRVLQKYTRGRGFGHKEMIRGTINLENNPENNNETLDKRAALMFRLSRSKLNSDSDSQSQQCWCISSILAGCDGRNADETVPFAQASLRDLIPNIVVRGQELLISRVPEIIQFIQPQTLAFLRKNFPHEGYRPNFFVRTLARQLLRETPQLRTKRQGLRLVKLLFDLFLQIDVHGAGIVQWGEFTSFCVEAGMTVSKARVCAPDVEFKFESMENKFKHYGYKYSKAVFWPQVRRIALIEDKSSKMRLIDSKTGALCLTLCIHAQIAYEGEKVDIDDGTAYSNLFDVLLFVHKKTNWIVTSGSNHTLSFWRYEHNKNEATWVNQITVETMQKILCLVPQSQQTSGSIWALGGENHALTIYDLGTKKRRYVKDWVHKDTPSCMIYIQALSLVATAAFDKTIKFWDHENGRGRGQSLVHEEPIKALSNVNDKIVSCGPCTVIIWDLQSFTVLCKLPVCAHDASFVSAKLISFNEISLGAQYRCITGDSKGRFKVWIPSSSTGHVDKPQLMQSFEGNQNLGNTLTFAVSAALKTDHSAAVWPDIVVCGSGRELELFGPRRVMKPHIPLVFSLHNKAAQQIITVENKSLHMWDISTGALTFDVPDASSNEITCVGTDFPLQRKLYVGNSVGTLQIFNITTGIVMSSKEAHSGAVTSVMYCEHSRHIITTGFDRSIAVFKDDQANLVQLRLMTDAHEAPISMADYSSHLSMIATVAIEEIKLFNFQDLQPQTKLDLHETEVTAIKFIPQFPLMVSADIQGRVLVWKIWPTTSMESAKCVCLVSCMNDDMLLSVNDVSSFGAENGEEKDEEEEYEIENENGDENDRHKQNSNTHKNSLTSRIRLDPNRENRKHLNSDMNAPSSPQSSSENQTNPQHKVLGNVRVLTVIFDEKDEKAAGIPLRLVASDFSGGVSFFEFDSIFAALEKSGNQTSQLSESQYSFNTENYNPHLRYEKNGTVYAVQKNYSLFPTIAVLSSLSFQAHDESILSVTSIVATPLFVTTASDCKLRVWAATDTFIGFQKHNAGSMFGELDMMDFEEKRIQKLEMWNCPNINNTETEQEHDMMALDALDYVERVNDSMHATQMANLLKKSMSKEQQQRVNLRDLGVHSSFLLAGATDKEHNNPLLQSRHDKQAIHAKHFNKRKNGNLQDANFFNAEKTSLIRNRLSEVNSQRQENQKRTALAKRASIVFQATAAEDGHEDNYEKEDSFLQKLATTKFERAKQFEIRKVLDGMRSHMISAAASKTRSGKVVYSHLYNEIKEATAKSGHSFTPVDTTPSTWLIDKFNDQSNQDAMERNVKRKMSLSAGNSPAVAARGSPKRRGSMSLLPPPHSNNTMDGKFDENDNYGGAVNFKVGEKVEPPSPTFFVTQRPETPQQKFSLDLGPGEVFGLSDDDESVGNDSVWTKTDETVESAMARINERAEQVEDMVNREESLMVYERVKQIKMKREGVKHLEGRKTLIARYQTEEQARTDLHGTTITNNQKAMIHRHSMQSIAKQAHYGSYARDDVMKLADLLCSMDKDNDGDIDAAEFEYYTKHGRHGDVFKDLNFDLMDLDHSGKITVAEIVGIVFANANGADQRKIMICISEEKKRRDEFNARRKKKVIGRRITTLDLQSAKQVFDFFDSSGSGTGLVEVDEICKGVKEEVKKGGNGGGGGGDWEGAALKKSDIKNMIGNFAVFNKTTKKLEISLASWVNFSYGFKGAFDVVDPRNGKVVESYKNDENGSGNNKVTTKMTTTTLPQIGE